MNASQRETYWLKVERLRRQLDKKYSSLFSGAIEKEVSEFAKMVERIGPEAARSSIAAMAWDDKLLPILRKLYRESAVIFGNAVYRAVGIESRKAYDPFDLNNDWLEELTSFLIQWGFLLVSQMTQTTKKHLILIINMSIEEGKSPKEIAEAIRTNSDLKYAVMRAMRIARTEVMRASNYASFVAAQKHPFVVDKMWVATRDSRTRRIPKDRYDHWDMDGQVKAYNEPFTSADILGRPISASYPGDPTAPAGFTINCRCTVAFVPRRDANGKIIMK